MVPRASNCWVVNVSHSYIVLFLVGVSHSYIVLSYFCRKVLTKGRVPARVINMLKLYKQERYQGTVPPWVRGSPLTNCCIPRITKRVPFCMLPSTSNLFESSEPFHTELSDMCLFHDLFNNPLQPPLVKYFSNQINYNFVSFSCLKTLTNCNLGIIEAGSKCSWNQFLPANLYFWYLQFRAVPS